MTDIYFRRYGGAAALMGLEVAEFCDLIDYAADQETEDRLFLRWAIAGQTQVSFDDFKQALQPPKFRNERELMEDIERIMNGGSNGNI